MTAPISRRNLLEASLLALPSAWFIGCRNDEQPRAVRPSEAAPDVRPVTTVVDATPAMDGAGVRLERVIGSRGLPMLDPFLLLDEIRSDSATDYIRGFPDHPHRGFETVTYMIDGVMEHRDSVGNHGRLVGGSAQWMTAGRGIVHSEMPKQERGLLWGFQLWVNLPRQDKMRPPRYQDIAPDRIPEVSAQGGRVRLVAGRHSGEEGPVHGIAVEPSLLELTLPARGRFHHELPHGHTAFAFVIAGGARLGRNRREVRRGQLAVFGAGNVVSVEADAGCRLLLAAGRPLREPVARRGPFVMNTEAELRQAFEDYRSGRLVGG